jgi:CHAT domain-containing protein/Tfp pilus assembly protein PilF
VPAPCFPGCRRLCDVRNRALARNRLLRKRLALAAGAWKRWGERIICYFGCASWRAVQLNNIGLVYARQGDCARALEHHQKALTIRRKVLGDQHPDVAASLTNIGQVYSGQRDYARALEHYQQALAVWRKVHGEQHANVATCLHSIGLAYYGQGDYARALEHYQQALAIWRKVHGEQYRDVATSLNSIGVVYSDQGDYARALEHYQQALAIRRKVLGEQHPDVATSLNSIGVVYSDQGDYARALEHYRQALAIWRKGYGEQHPDVATCVNNIGQVYFGQRDYARALGHYQQALAIWRKVHGEQHPDVATCLHNIGQVYYGQGDYARALEHYQQALAIWRKVYGEQHPELAGSLHNIGQVYAYQGDYARALEHYRQALGLCRKGYGEQHPDVATSLTSIGAVYSDQGDYARALPAATEAVLALRLPGKTTAAVERLAPTDLSPLPLTALALHDRSRILEAVLALRGASTAQADTRACAVCYALASAVLDRLRQDTLQSSSSKVLLGADRANLVSDRVRVCWYLFDREGKVADLAGGFSAVEQGRARVFLETLGRSRAHHLGGVSPKLQAEERDLLALLRRCDERIRQEQDKPFEKRNSERVGQLVDERQQAEARLQKLIARMEHAYPQYAALKHPKPCTVEQARACLGDNEVALLYAVGSRSSFVVLVEKTPRPGDKGQGLAIVPLGDTPHLASQVATLTDPDTLGLEEDTRRLGEELYQLLLQPVAERIKGKDLVIVPDRSLCLLPFELLVEGDHYLVEGHRIRYAPSLTVLHLGKLWDGKREHRPDRPLLALGDPDYGTQVAAASRDALRDVLWREGRRGDVNLLFRRLQHSRAQVEAIGRLLGARGDDLLLGPEAREAHLKEASASGRLAHYRYLHFATHGILGAGDGQQPALVLSLSGNDGKPDGTEGINDGFLRLDEVTRLKLNADLVVLSACRTGQGRLSAAEGVEGLARAFLFAGSKGVACSLWSVDDRETADLMVKMYGRLRQGQPAADALRAAKLEMIRARKAPFYWAPFILIGE